MLTNEEQTVINRLKETAKKIDEDYEAGLMSENVYKAKCKLVEDAADKIEAISGE